MNFIIVTLPTLFSFFAIPRRVSECDHLNNLLKSFNAMMSLHSRSKIVKKVPILEFEFSPIKHVLLFDDSDKKL